MQANVITPISPASSIKIKDPWINTENAEEWSKGIILNKLAPSRSIKLAKKARAKNILKLPYINSLDLWLAFLIDG